jgi:tetratricopeptide (TPR) repeat protein
MTPAKIILFFILVSLSCRPRLIVKDDSLKADATLALTAYKEQNFSLAKEKLLVILEKEKENIEAHKMLIECFKELGEGALGVEYYQKLKEKQPLLVISYYGIGQLLVAQGKYEEAIKEYISGLEKIVLAKIENPALKHLLEEGLQEARAKEEEARYLCRNVRIEYRFTYLQEPDQQRGGRVIKGDILKNYDSKVYTYAFKDEKGKEHTVRVRKWLHTRQPAPGTFWFDEQGNKLSYQSKEEIGVEVQYDDEKVTQLWRNWEGDKEEDKARLAKIEIGPLKVFFTEKTPPITHRVYSEREDRSSEFYHYFSIRRKR